MKKLLEIKPPLIVVKTGNWTFSFFLATKVGGWIRSPGEEVDIMTDLEVEEAEDISQDQTVGKVSTPATPSDRKKSQTKT